MAIKYISKALPIFQSAQATEYIRGLDRRQQSDVVNYNDSSPVTVFSVPPNTLVTGVIVEVVTAFNGNIPSISLGVAGTTERHLGVADVDIKTAGFTTIIKPFEYTAAASIICTVVQGGASQGKVRFWLTYRPASNIQG